MDENDPGLGSEPRADAIVEQSGLEGGTGEAFDAVRGRAQREHRPAAASAEQRDIGEQPLAVRPLSGILVAFHRRAGRAGRANELLARLTIVG